MRILTVTCDRDRWLFELQTQSFKFLDPCEINVVINEDHPETWLSWYEGIKPKNHIVKVYDKKQFTDNTDGWIAQQLIKLYFSKFSNDEYIVLDSKNFFTRNHTNIKQCRRSALNNFKMTQLELGLTEYIPPCTPYIIDPKISTQLITDDFEKWFLNLPEPSEFLVYDWFIQRNNIHVEFGDPCSKTLWYYETYTYDEWTALSFPILGIHPWFIKMNPTIDWKSWLEAKGLDLPKSPLPQLSKLDWNKLCG